MLSLLIISFSQQPDIVLSPGVEAQESVQIQIEWISDSMSLTHPIDTLGGEQINSESATTCLNYCTSSNSVYLSSAIL